MSITLEKLIDADPQDHQDLLAIYADCPELLAQITEPTQPPMPMASLLHELLDDRKRVCWAARFNGRIIAAIFSEDLPPDACRVAGLAIRPSSRDRGVEARVLQRLLAKLRPLHDEVRACIAPAIAQELEANEACGFILLSASADEACFRRKA